MGNIFDYRFVSDQPVQDEIMVSLYKIDSMIPHIGCDRFLVVQRSTARRSRQIDNRRPEISLRVVRRLLAAIAADSVIVISPLFLRRIDDNDAIGFHDFRRSISSQNESAST